MHLSKLVIILLFCLLTGCIYSSLFNRQVWIGNSDVRDTSNPRARMVDDVIKNHLKPGLPRKAVLNLLGKPSHEAIERRLPKTTILPDSISYTNDQNLKPENSEKTMNAINEFYKLYAEPVLILRYPVGWSTIDPNFLIIKLTSKGLVEDYWVEQG